MMMHVCGPLPHTGRVCILGACAAAVATTTEMFVWLGADTLVEEGSSAEQAEAATLAATDFHEWAQTNVDSWCANLATPCVVETCGGYQVVETCCRHAKCEIDVVADLLVWLISLSQAGCATATRSRAGWGGVGRVLGVL
jgi:hypothetical protein